MTTTYAGPEPERRAPIRAGRAPAETEALVPIRGGLLASAALVAVAATALAVIGFTGSYRSVRDLALGWGWGWFSYVFPVGIDVGIIGLMAADLFLCAIRTPAPILRWFAWTLTVATVVFNAASGWPSDGSAGWMDYVEAGAHATMPGLVVVITEALRRAIARRARIADGHQFEPLGLARWILAPFSTFAIWRRMRLWDVYTRKDALDLERDRLTLRDELREKYGKDWKRKARPRELRVMRDASRGLPIPAHMIANADPSTANAAAAAIANDGQDDRERPAITNGPDGTANGPDGTVRGTGQPFVNDMSTGQPTANDGFVDMGTPRTAGDGDRERTAYVAPVPAGVRGAELGHSHRERSSVPAVSSSRTFVKSTVPAPYTPHATTLVANRANGTANGAVRDADLTAYGANADREGEADAALGEDRERSVDRHAEARAERRRLALAFLKARETESPPPSQAKFAAREGVAPARMTKALQEWREEHGG
ncbi:DUF2637 domain-containing protein [Streptomyces ipomoeae]|uniref:DUF2637 domain-containing protein n=1 Tax=Streptomyces ipomoeae TaxID=103232 RepID=UPI0029AB9267|nr:DUF2637 domain-containing protein [Streptomyces ipomoeae]MDX2692212.1 DUF2637 domain-containing protein [Streptomyces ipomoeae]MDX2843572.1 DUF2637 domain-containing protein [Streptomyces ipomoeae]